MLQFSPAGILAGKQLDSGGSVGVVMERVREGLRAGEGERRGLLGGLDGRGGRYWGSVVGTPSNYCCTSSTRRFLERPSSVTFDATGAVGPAPKEVILEPGIPCC